MGITLGIITKNEEGRIEACILSARDIVDEIVIVDDYSVDNTEEIARRLGAKVYKRRLDDFSSQRNYLIGKATNEWILIIDSDERIEDALRSEIMRVLPDSASSAFMVLRKNFIFGRHLKYGGNKDDWTLRLFRKDKARYVNPVHEKLVVEGQVGRLSAGCLMHYSIDNISSYMAKLNTYTDLESSFIKRRRFLALRLVIAPVFEFTKRYFVQLGFMDGREGFLFCALSSFYAFIKYAKAILK